jgi:hypothetical protein
LAAVPKIPPCEPQGWRGEPPNLYDISGSAHFINKADNGLVIHRNRDPEQGQLNHVRARVYTRHAQPLLLFGSGYLCMLQPQAGPAEPCASGCISSMHQSLPLLPIAGALSACTCKILLSPYMVAALWEGVHDCMVLIACAGEGAGEEGAQQSRRHNR